MSEPWGIDGIEWDGEGPVLIQGRAWPLAVDPEWCSYDGTGPEHWKGNSISRDAPFPGFHFWVPFESGLFASVWIEKDARAWLNWSRSPSIAIEDWALYDIPVMRVKGTNFVQPMQYDAEIGVWHDPFLPTWQRRKGRDSIGWAIAGRDALGTPVEELREMLVEFGRYGKDPQLTGSYMVSA